MFETIFDLETKSFFNDSGTSDPADLGVSLVSIYYRELDADHKEVSGRTLSFWETEIDKMWKYFWESDRIIGFNSLHFDVPALKPYSPAGFAKLNHFDLLSVVKEETGRRFSLNSFAKTTLGIEKIDSGANAISYWQSQDPQKLALLKKYCEADVDITKRIYDFGKENKYLKYIDFWNTVRTVEIDFSYPANFTPQDKQVSLF